MHDSVWCFARSSDWQLARLPMLSSDITLNISWILKSVSLMSSNPCWMTCHGFIWQKCINLGYVKPGTIGWGALYTGCLMVCRGSQELKERGEIRWKICEKLKQWQIKGETERLAVSTARQRMLLRCTWSLISSVDVVNLLFSSSQNVKETHDKIPLSFCNSVNLNKPCYFFNQSFSCRMQRILLKKE